MENNEIKSNLVKLGIWDKVKLAFSEVIAPAPVVAKVVAPAPVSLAEVKTKEGAVISYEGDKLDIGVAVKMVNADGTTMDAVDGEYELEDGTKITIKGGLVEALVPVAVVDPVIEPMATPEMAAQLATVQTQLEAQTKEFADLKLKFEVMEKTLEANTGHVKTSLEAINAICKTPAATNTVTKVKAYEELTKAEQVKHNRGKLA